MHLNALLVIAPNWEQSECPGAGGGADKRWCIHRTEYYSALAKSEPWAHTATCVNLAALVPNKKYKSTSCMIPLKSKDGQNQSLVMEITAVF